MDIILIIVLILSLAAGTTLGYYIRQTIAKRRAGSLEAKLQKRVQDVKQETAELVKNAEAKASEITEKAQKDIDQRRSEFLKAEQILLDREKLLDSKIDSFDKKELELEAKVSKVKEEKESLDKLRGEAEVRLEKVASLSKEDAKKELLALVEVDYQKDIIERIKKIEQSGQDALNSRAREIVTLAIQ
jgi:ribonuclease Y